MLKITLSFILLTSILNRCQFVKSEEMVVPELELVRALPVDNGPDLLEPSGLAEWKGVFFTVADKDNSTVYRLEFEKDVVRMVEHFSFKPPSSGSMDWEGISIDADGNFYLISESYGRIAKVTIEGESEWVTPDLRPIGREKGLFAKLNAGFEGVTWLDSDHYLGAVEREPRGFVEYRELRGSVSTQAFESNATNFGKELPLLRIPDYSGLDTDEGYVYGLFRNAHLVVQLSESENGYTEKQAWSFKHIERDKRWAYLNQTFGQAEGLVVTDGRVFLIFDNNREARLSDKSDRRSLFVEAKIPPPVVAE